jgi:hypothetical protein
LPGYIRVLFILSLLLLIPGVTFAQDLLPVVTSHALCKEIRNGKPGDVTNAFTTVDTIYSYIEIKNPISDTEIKWLFRGPGSIKNQFTYKLKAGEQSCFGKLDLSQYMTEQATGVWAVTIYVDDIVALTDRFTVDSAHGQVKGGLLPCLYIGLAVLIVIVAIIVLVFRQRRYTI